LGPLAELLGVGAGDEVAEGFGFAVDVFDAVGLDPFGSASAHTARCGRSSVSRFSLPLLVSVDKIQS
jgi:hypothetical protein